MLDLQIKDLQALQLKVLFFRDNRVLLATLYGLTSVNAFLPLNYVIK